MKTSRLTILLLAILGIAGVCSAAAPGDVQVKWFGQAFFELTSSEGVKVAVDPFDNTYFSYAIPSGLTADILLISHEHKDHNNAGIIGGSPLICRSEKGVGKFECKGVRVIGTAAFHDDKGGSVRGPDTVYSFVIDGVRFCHAGDLGQLLTPQQIESIGPVDVLFLPAGGHFTLEVGKLDQLVAQLKPRVVVPMHYKTDLTPKLPIAPVDEFLDKKANVKRIGASSFTVNKNTLPAQQEIWVLDVK